MNVFHFVGVFADPQLHATLGMFLCTVCCYVANASPEIFFDPVVFYVIELAG